MHFSGDGTEQIYLVEEEYGDRLHICRNDPKIPGTEWNRWYLIDRSNGEANILVGPFDDLGVAKVAYLLARSAGGV